MIDESVFKIKKSKGNNGEASVDITDEELLSMFGSKKKDHTLNDSSVEDSGSESGSPLDNDLSSYIPEPEPKPKKEDALVGPPTQLDQLMQIEPETRYSKGFKNVQQGILSHAEKSFQKEIDTSVAELQKKYEEKLRLNPGDEKQIRGMYEQDVQRILDEMNLAYEAKMNKDLDIAFEKYSEAYGAKITGEEKERIEQEKLANRIVRENLPPNIRFGMHAFKFWETLAYQIPGASAIGMAAWMDEEPMAQTPYGAVPIYRKDDPRRAKGVKDLLEKKKALVEWGSEWQKKGINPLQIQSYKDVNLADPMSILEYGVAAIAETAAQMPIAVIPGIGQVVMTLQETGSSYEQQLIQIAAKHGISVDEVIEQGLDEPLYAQIAGTIAGGLESISAINIVKAFGGMKGIQKAISSRLGTLLRTGGIEAVTEYLQEYTTSIGAQMGIDPNFKSASMTAWRESQEQMKESAMRGLIGGMALGGAGASMRKQADPTSKAKREIPKVSDKIEVPKLTLKDNEKIDDNTKAAAEAMEQLGIGGESKEHKEEVKSINEQRDKEINEKIKTIKVAKHYAKFDNKETRERWQATLDNPKRELEKTVAFHKKQAHDPDLTPNQRKLWEESSKEKQQDLDKLNKINARYDQQIADLKQKPKQADRDAKVSGVVDGKDNGNKLESKKEEKPAESKEGTSETLAPVKEEKGESKLIPNASYTKGLFEYYKSDTIEINVSGIDKNGDGATNTEPVKFRVTISMPSMVLKDGEMKMKDSLTEEFDDFQSAEEYANKFINSDQKKEKSKENNQPKGFIDSRSIDEKQVKADVFLLPMQDLHTDKKRFQNRNELDEDIVNDIAENYKAHEFEAIVVWKDPEDGNTYVLSGHHREAGRRRAGAENIEAKYFEGTEQEAMVYAKERANANRTMEKPSERAKIYRKMRDDGKSKAEIKRKAVALEGANAQRALDYSYLNPDGITHQSLVQFENTGESESGDRIKNVAQWIGVARNYSEDLSNSHENELYNYLVNSTGGKKIVNKQQFRDLVDRRVNNIGFDKNAPLNLENAVAHGPAETQLNEQFSELASKKRELINKKNNATTSQEITSINAELNVIEIKERELKGRLGEAKESDRNQLDIFGSQADNIITEEMKSEGIENISDKTIGDIKSRLDPIDKQLIDKISDGTYSSENIMLSGLQDEINDRKQNPNDYFGILDELSDQEIDILNKILNEEAKPTAAASSKQSQKDPGKDITESTEGKRGEREEVGKSQEKQVEQPASKPKTTKDTFAKNKVVNADRMEELKRKMREKLGGQLNVGFDPEMAAMGMEMAVGYIEAGYHAFADFSKVMIGDFGDAIKPYLRSFYESARHFPEFDASKMSSAEQIERHETRQNDKYSGIKESYPKIILKKGQWESEYDAYRPFTETANISLVEGGGMTSYQIITENDDNVMGFVKDVDFPKDKKSKTRGEIMMLSIRSEKGKGTGTSLVIDALRLMRLNGVETVKMTVPSKEGKPFNDALERKGYIKKIREHEETGTVEYEILDEIFDPKLTPNTSEALNVELSKLASKEKKHPKGEKELVNVEVDQNPSNDSFSKIQTFTLKGGVLELGMIKGRSHYSVINLQVDENSRRQGIATKLLKQALSKNGDNIASQVSNAGSAELHYKLGFRAQDKDGNDLSLEEIKQQISERGSYKMIAPKNENPNNNVNKDRDVSDRPGHIEQDKPAADEVSADEGAVQSERPGSREVGGKDVGAVGEQKQQEGRKGSDDKPSSSIGIQGDLFALGEKPTGQTKPAGDPNAGRGGKVGDERGVEPGARRSSDDNGGIGEAAKNLIKSGLKKVAESFKSKNKKKFEKQKAVENVPVKVGDMDNIVETLPFLLPEQHEDILTIEQRFNNAEHQTHERAYGKGILFTNGTGTGKTFVGLGAIKRAIKQGKENILIVTPSQQKVSDWIDEGRNLLLNITAIEDTKDKGKGLNITTFANFYANQAIKNRDFDLIIYDESHRIMDNKTGTPTATYFAHQANSNVSLRNAEERLKSVHPLWMREKELQELIREEIKSMTDDQMDQAYFAAKSREEQYDKELKVIREKQKKAEPALKERAKKAYENTKVIFLSATPFKSHQNLRIGNQVLFDWGDKETYQQASNTMSRVDAESRFYLDNFGAQYEWKYHRLQNKSDINADAVAMQEIAFAEKMMKDGVSSGRTINSEMDYQRLFPKMAGFSPETFNKAYSQLKAFDGDFIALQDFTKDIFDDYNYKTKLFEVLRANAVLDRVKKHLALGRQIVIFHRRHQSGVEAPFAHVLRNARITAKSILADKNNSSAKDLEHANAILDQADVFESKFADLMVYEQTLDYRSAVDQFKDAFGEQIMFFNGNAEYKKNKKVAVDSFNDDASKTKIIMIQEESGKEGISLHDTSGKSQRVTINLSLPISSTTALQIEGRTYRIGNESNAIFEYPLLGLDVETTHFGSTINKRLSTTENLAMGNQSRDLLRSFAEGVLFNSDQTDPSTEHGFGGKEYDKRIEGTISDYQKAILIYSTNQKIRGRRDQREGQDYFATPEPVGQKMIVWGGFKEGDQVLEPSAGHGAIAMWVPKTGSLKAIEPSYDLFSKLNARMGGGTSEALNIPFEEHNIINKYDVIVMNPPFGQGGSMAMEHLAKAFKHLRNGGRVVALLPDGGSMNKRLEKFREDGTNEELLKKGMAQDARNIHTIANIKLPSVTFEQAGTSVGTQIIIFERQDTTENALKLPLQRNLDFRHIEKIQELFDALEDVDFGKRVEVEKDTSETLAPAEVRPNKMDVEVKEKVDKGTTTIVKNRHAKKGIDIWVVKLGDRVEREAFTNYKDIAKRYNGYYSSYKGRGAIPGFIFETEKDAQRFKLSIEGVSDSDIDHMIDKASEGLGDIPREQGQGFGGGGKAVKQNKTDLQKAIEIEDAEVEASFTAADQESIKSSKLRELWDNFVVGLRNFKRHFEHLNPQKLGREANLLRVFESAPKQVKKRTEQYLRILFEPLTHEQKNIVVRRIVFEDLLGGINAGLEKEGALPFKLKNKAQVERLVQKYTNLMNSEPKALKSYNTRQAIMGKLYEELKAKGIIKDKGGDQGTYYHRMVLTYIEDDINKTILAGKRLTQAQKSWKKSRTGSRGLDFSTNFIESEFKVFAESLYEIKKKDTLDELFEPYMPLLPQLRKEGREAFEKALKDAEAMYGIESDEYQAFKAGKKKAVHDYVNEHKPDEYIVYQPDPGNKLFRMMHYTEKQLEDAIMEIAEKDDSGIGEALEVLENLTEQAKSILAVGPKKPEYLIPEELAVTLEDMGRPQKAMSGFKVGQRFLLSSWKIYVLLNPRRFFKYNLNNMMGDLDGVISADPTILKKGRMAGRELGKFYKTGETKGTLVNEAMNQDVIDSGFEYTELADINDVDWVKYFSNEKSAEVSRLFNKRSLLNVLNPGNLVKDYFRLARKYSVMRENWLRYAAFARAIEKIERGDVFYWASDPKQIDDIQDKYQKAGKLAREVLGDYGNISETGKSLRRGLLPFYSWMEVNFGRYYWLMKNASSPEVQARVTSMMIGKGVVKTSAKMMRAYLYTTLFTAAIGAWNKLMFPDEDEELRLINTRGMQFILYRTEDGKVITLPIVGAMYDAADWFGFPDLWPEIEMIINGTAPKKGFTEGAKKILLAPVNKIAQGLNPFAKSAAELTFGKTVYPDVTNPRPIYDKVEYGARFFSMQDEYKAIKGTPTRKPYFSSYWFERFVMMEIDPREMAFYATRNLVGKYKGNKGFASKHKDRSNALYNYRQAVRFDKTEEASKWLEKYYELGGKRKDMKMSIRKQHPLAWLTNKEKAEALKYMNGDLKKDQLKYEFSKELTPSDLKRMRLAIQYYQDTYKK